jgi:UDP:flavonoid glycosyltransferase YjiC (YdhE family)
MAFMRFVSKNLIFKESTVVYNEILSSYGLKPVKEAIFDIVVQHTDLYLQIGVPGFEYPRRQISKNVHFIGSLLPYKKSLKHPFAHEDKLSKYKKVILISQGTVDNKEPEKLIIPTLEALKQEPYLLIVATGNSKTAELREKYPHENIIIEDFVDFDYILPYVDVFVTNGGYGSTMLSISHNVPLVAAGVHEGKNEITARIGYFNVGINLKTDHPKSTQIKNSVKEVLHNQMYKNNVARLKEEIAKYNPLEISEKHIAHILKTKAGKKQVPSLVE